MEMRREIIEETFEEHYEEVPTHKPKRPKKQIAHRPVQEEPKQGFLKGMRDLFLILFVTWGGLTILTLIVVLILKFGFGFDLK